MMRTVVLSSLVTSLVWVLMTLVAFSLALPPLVSAQGERIRAEQFTLVGTDGEERLTMMETRFGGAAVQIRQAGVTRASLIAANRDPESTALSLQDTDGRRRIWLALKQGTTAGATGDITGIAVLDQEERIRAHIGVAGDGSPFIQLLDADGNVTWGAQ